MSARLLVAGVALALLAGCSGIDHADIENQTTPPGDSTFGTGGGSLREGIAIGFTPHVWTRNTIAGTTEQSSGITVKSSNPSIVGVAPVTSAGAVTEVVWAVAPGKATVTLEYGGQDALDIAVTVMPAQSP